VLRSHEWSWLRSVYRGVSRPRIGATKLRNAELTVVERAEGNRDDAEMARHCSSPGVEERGMFTRVAQEPGRARLLHAKKGGAYSKGPVSEWFPHPSAQLFPPLIWLEPRAILLCQGFHRQTRHLPLLSQVVHRPTPERGKPGFKDHSSEGPPDRRPPPPFPQPSHAFVEQAQAQSFLDGLLGQRNLDLFQGDGPSPKFS